MANGKQPYAIVRQDGEPMAFAGLWEGFRWPDGTILRSFTIVTTDANAEMAELPDRMPASWSGQTGLHGLARRMAIPDPCCTRRPTAYCVRGQWTGV